MSFDDAISALSKDALKFVKNKSILGLGSGRAATAFVESLGDYIKEKDLSIKAIPTSLQIKLVAEKNGIHIIDSGQVHRIDAVFDGADQIDAQRNLIKGGGGALLKEKIVAAAARRLIIVVDHTKRVPVLGNSFPLPIEVVPFGWGNTARQLEAIAGKAVLRERDGRPFHTEAGHFILDLHLGSIPDPADMEIRLNQVPGVVETGLFVGRTSLLMVGTPEGVVLQAAPQRS